MRFFLSTAYQFIPPVWKGSVRLFLLSNNQIEGKLRPGSVRLNGYYSDANILTAKIDQFCSLDQATNHIVKTKCNCSVLDIMK